MDKKEIVYKVKAHALAEVEELKPFQGDLKNLSDENFNRLRGQIVASGFNFAPHVWIYGGHKYILDGHQRLHVLRQLKKEGYLVGPVPINIVEADDFEDAKRKVLQSVSQYGKVSQEGFNEFTAELDIDLSDFDIPGIETPDVKIDDNEFEFNPPADGGGSKEDFILKVICKSDEEMEELFLELNERDFLVKR